MVATPKIFAALAAVGKELPAVAKNAKNSHQGWTYRSAESLMNALHPVLFKNGITVLPESIETVLWERDSKNWIHCVLKIHYQWIAEDGSSVQTIGIGEAKDNGDKVVGKCLTYAFKTMLNVMFVVPTEDMQDPDESSPALAQESKEPGVYMSTAKQKTLLSTIVKKLNPEATIDQLRAIDRHCHGVVIEGLESKIKEFLQ